MGTLDRNEGFLAGRVDLAGLTVVDLGRCRHKNRARDSNHQTFEEFGLIAGREPEAFTVRLQDMDMMGEAIKQRACEPF